MSKNARSQVVRAPRSVEKKRAAAALRSGGAAVASGATSRMSDPLVQVSFRARRSVYRRLRLRALRDGHTIQSWILLALMRNGLPLLPRDLADRRRNR